MIAELCPQSSSPRAERDLSRSARADHKFRAAHQIEILAALNKDRSSACARAYCGANRRAFTATGNRSNHRADGRANASARHGAAGLAIFILRPSLIINPDGFTTRRPDTLNVSGEVGGAAIAQPDAVELSDISARPETCPERLIFAIWPSMLAPSYCEGDRTVKVKRSPSCACFVLRLSFRVATSWVPSGTTKLPPGDAGMKGSYLRTPE